jgi:Xaa-Pro aminopeptidase
MKSKPIASTLFLKNRTRLASLMSPGSLALIRSGRPKVRSGDQFYPFRAHSDFFYLTGMDLEESVLLFAPGHAEPLLRELLFIKRPDPKSGLWTGHTPGPDEIRVRTGIEEIRWLDEQEAILQMLLPDAPVIYTDHKLPDLKGSPSMEQKLYALSPLLQELRMIKQTEEIQVIEKAIDITGSAFRRVLRKAVPGIYEYQLEAEIIGEFIGRGATGHAFEPIVACGKNALVLHYVTNNSLCGEGELLLMDFGAEVNHYSADCSRTIPVSGRFTGRQRQLYDAVLRVLKKAREMMVPGVLMDDFHQAVGEIWEEEHIGLGLYTREEAKAHAKTEPLWKKYFMHGTSHSLGLDVHDPFNRMQPFEAGMVLTCEPAMYIREENLGIRLENDILITKQGPVDLMEDIPIEPDEIEELMNRTR